MTWRTHFVFGISSLWLVLPLLSTMPDGNLGVLAACASFGALLHDLDAPESKIKHLKFGNSAFKPFLLPAQIVHGTDRHRGLLHSLLGLSMVGLLCLPPMLWIGWAPVMALLLGYASHLAGDSMTKCGILLLYPRKKAFHLLPRTFRLTTGSQAEEVLFVLFALGTVFLLLRTLLRLPV
jgi:inner membrane protein